MLVEFRHLSQSSLLVCCMEETQDWLSKGIYCFPGKEIACTHLAKCSKCLVLTKYAFQLCL